MRTRPSGRLVVGVFAALVLVLLPLGSSGSLLLYVLVTTATAAACLREPRHAPHTFVAAAAITFAVARVVSFVAPGSSLENAAYSVSYLPAVAASVLVFRARVRRPEMESVIEALGFSIGAALLFGELGNIFGSTPASGQGWFELIVFVILLSLSSSTIGRTPNPIMRLWVTSGFLIVLVELIDGSKFEDARTVGSWLAAACFLPILIGALRPDRADLTRESMVSARRQFGLVQFVTVALWLSIPVVLLAKAGLDGERARIVVLGGASFIGLLTALIRVKYLVALRDWSFAQESRLRGFARDLVAMDTQQQVREAVVEVMRDIVSGPAEIAILDATSVPVAEATKGLIDRSKTGRTVTESDETSPWLADRAWAATAIEVAVPSEEEDLTLAVASVATERAELRDMMASVSSQVALVLETQEARERTHRERADRRFRGLVQDSSDIIFIVDPDEMTVQFASPTLERLLGFAESEVVGRAPLDLLVDDDREVIESVQQMLGSARTLSSTDVRARHADGFNHWLSLSIRDMCDDPDVEGLVFNFADINERKLAELQIRTSELQYRTMVLNSSDVFAVVDDDYAIDYVSPNVERMLGYRAADLMGTDVRGVLTDRGRSDLNHFLESHDLSSDQTVDLQVHTQGGKRLIAEISLTDAAQLGSGVMVTMRDVTENRRLEEAIRNQALHDDLTGLLNRTSMRAELERVLQDMQQGQYLGVIHLDIDNFHPINESIGFDAGDELLIDVAARLRSRLRAYDLLARPTGDEFTVVSIHDSREDVIEFSERLHGVFDEPFTIGQHVRKVDASLGVVATSDLLVESRRVLEAAAIAVKLAKVDTSTSRIVFEKWMREEAAEHYEIAAAIGEAIENESFQLAYQPVLALGNRRVRSVEALLRWQHPVRGSISPGLFIPMAERSGEIVELGRWVLGRACRQLVKWQQELPGGAELGMAVNVSARQLERTGEINELRQTILDSGIDPSYLTLELTETVMIDDSSSLREQLETFRELGVKIAVDDFGTGAAGFNHLRDVPFDVLKIDKTYVDHIETNVESQTLVAGVIELAHNMGAKAVAEGIETPAQADVLRRLNCDYGQGFYLGRPMDSNRLEIWFAQGWDGEVPALIERSTGW